MTDVKINRREFLEKFGKLALSVALAGGGYTYAQAEKERLVIERVEVPLPRLNPALEGFRIVQMSDFHFYPYTELDFIRQAIHQANVLEPDLILLTGDYAWHDNDSIYELTPVLNTLNARYGIFTVMGNHDARRGGGPNIVKPGLEAAHLPVLDNMNLTFQVGKATLSLAGIDDALNGRPNLYAALDGLPPAGTGPVIMLAHEPDLAERISRTGRIALQLSGHSHGGQVRIPGLGALILPRLGQKYDQGLYRVNDMWLYTNRGIGVTGIPYRFNCLPEITELTLVSQTHPKSI